MCVCQSCLALDRQSRVSELQYGCRLALCLELQPCKTALRSVCYVKVKIVPMHAMKLYGGREWSASRPGCSTLSLYVLEKRGIDPLRLGRLHRSLVTVPTELPDTGAPPVLLQAVLQPAVSTGTAAGQALCPDIVMQRAQNERRKGSPVCLLHSGRSCQHFVKLYLQVKSCLQREGVWGRGGEGNLLTNHGTKLSG